MRRPKGSTLSIYKSPFHTNDFIEKELSTLSYISIDNIAQVVLQLGKGTLLGKMDVKEAFRLVPVHPSDRLLLGMTLYPSGGERLTVNLHFPGRCFLGITLKGLV